MKLRRGVINCSVTFCLVMLIINSSVTQGKEKPATVGDLNIALKPIKLLPPQTDIGRPLMQVLKDRKTIRKYSDKKILDQDLSNILWAAYGINRPEKGYRTAPSAVNWQVIDIYVVLEGGLYLYDFKAHQLKPVLAGDFRAEATQLLQPNRKYILKAPLTFIYVADSAKRNLLGMTVSHYEKKMYAASDTGFISQNVYLYCASEGLGTVVRAMIDRKKLHKVMGLREDQTIILAQSVGHPLKKKKEASALAKIPDGTYHGASYVTIEEAEGKKVVYEVEVSVKNHQITDIRILNSADSEYDIQLSPIIDLIIKNQYLDVDAVSGATLSSNALLDAIDKALKSRSKGDEAPF